MASEEVTEFAKKLEAFDDGLEWGHIDKAGAWHPLPKTPMLLAEMGPPPFDVTLPDGRVRHVVHKPE